MLILLIVGFMKLVKKIEIGSGVIDCAISVAQKRVIAGDVNGNTIVYSYENNDVVFQHKEDMPVWGVDISEDGRILSIALASKSPQKGKFIVIKDGDVVFSREVDHPTWDTKIISKRGKVYCSTWGGELLEYDLETESDKTIKLNGNLFGIDYNIKKDYLLVVSSGNGIYELGSDGQINIIENASSCYKAYIDTNCENIYTGSFNNKFIHINIDNGSVREYKTLLNQICGISEYGNYIIYGDLSGTLLVCPKERKNFTFVQEEMPGAIWSIKADEASSLIFISCGDGSLYIVDGNLESQTSRTNAKNIDKNLLKGVNVFISYASEDMKHAKLIYDALESFGCHVWMDKYNILPGQDWEYEIDMAIKKSDFFVLCMSNKSTTKKGFVQKEIRKALEILDEIPDGGIFLIPIRLDNCQIPSKISSRQWVDIYEEDGLYKLLYSIYLEKRKSIVSI